MKKLHYLIIILQLILLSNTLVNAQVRLRIPNLSTVAGQTINVPIIADSSFTGKGIYSYTLDITFSDYYLTATSILTTGTISSAFGSPAVNYQAGRVTIAGAGSTPLTGNKGDTLIIIRFSALIAGGSSISFTGSSLNYFNEGNPLMTFENGYVSINYAPSISISPGSGIVLRGETLAFSVNGSGTPPYTWEVINSSIGSIDPTGLFSATNVGITKVKVTDNVGLTAQTTGNIEVRGYKLSIPNNLSEWQGSTINIPVNVTNLNGLNIVAGNLSVSYNQNILNPVQILTEGTLLESYNAPVVNFGNGQVTISFAGATPLIGSGILLYIKFDISAVNQGGSSLDLSNALFNEDLLGITQNGYFSTINFANISISPNSSTLIAGQTLPLVASNGVEPYTWSVDNTNSATIDQTGNLLALRSGKVYVKVTDNVGATKTSGLFNIYDTKVYFPDTISLGLTTFDIPLFINEFPADQSISSIEASIQFQNPELEFVQLVTNGTLSEGWNFVSNLNGNILKIAGAGSTEFTANSYVGKAPVVKLRFQLTADHTMGEYAYVNINELILNEGLPNALTDNGRIRVVNDYNVTLLANPDNIGAVLTGSGVYLESSKVTITAQVPDGYNFVNWTGAYSDIVLLGNPLALSTTFTMPARDVELTANYQSIIPKYNLMLVANPVEGGTVTGSGEYEEGASVSIAAMANSGYIFVNWTDAGANVVSTNASFSYTMPGSAATLTANFVVEPPPSYNLTLETNPSGAGVLTEAGEYQEGTEVSITATPNSGYIFINWTDAGANVVSTNANFSYTMPGANATLTANFELISYNVSVDVSPSLSGSVSGSGAYNAGDEVTLLASANTGYTFLNWQIAGTAISSANPYIFSMPAENVNITAHFVAQGTELYTLTLNVSPAGSGLATGAGDYESGSNIQLVAIPNTGYSFVNWTDAGGNIVSTSATFTYTMPSSNTALIANFEVVIAPKYVLDLDVNPSEAGITSGSNEYQAGTEVPISATANAGYAFVNWTDGNSNIVSSLANFTYTMPANDVTLTANFALIDYNVNINITPDLSGTATGAGTYNLGDVVSLLASPNTGYTFLNWQVGGTVVSSANPYLFSMPAENVTITAHFIPDGAPLYTLSLNVNPAGAGNVFGSGSYEGGSNILLSATANSGYEFSNWTNESSVVVNNQASFTYTMPSSNTVLTANFNMIIVQQSQSITFAALPVKTFGDSPFTLEATASSGLNVAFSSSNPAVATISGNTVTIVGAGTTTITATQAGNENYFAATPVDQILTVNKANQTILFDAISDKLVTDAPFTLSVSVSSGLNPSFSSSNTSVATVSGKVVTIVGAGTTVITASQSGNENYNPAVNVQQSFTVNKLSQSITFNPISNQQDNGGVVNLTATASSGLTITYQVTGPATLSGVTLNLTGAGKVTVTATQPGNATYAAATPVSQEFCVNPLPVITKQSGTTTQYELVSNYASGNQWIKDGLDISEATGTIFQVLQSGLYRLRVTIDGCIGLSDNMDVTLTSIDSPISSESLRLYPNPVTNVLYLNGDASRKIKVSIFDSSGKLVVLSQLVDNQIDVSTLPIGHYTLKAEIDKEVKVLKFIKR